MGPQASDALVRSGLVMRESWQSCNSCSCRFRQEQRVVCGWATAECYFEQQSPFHAWSVPGWTGCRDFVSRGSHASLRDCVRPRPWHPHHHASAVHHNWDSRRRLGWLRVRISAPLVSIIMPLHLTSPRRGAFCCCCCCCLFFWCVVVCSLIQDVDQGWRGLIGFGAVPAVLQVLMQGMFPESPKWLIKQGHLDQAKVGGWWGVMAASTARCMTDPAFPHVTGCHCFSATERLQRGGAGQHHPGC